MRKKNYISDNQGKAAFQPCSWEGCCGFGEHPAPRSREQLRDYYWFCLEHIREYNKSWNYFADMDDGEVEEYNRNVVHQHRPTWKMGVRAGVTQQQVLNAVFTMFGDKYTKRAEIPPALPKPIRDALHTLDLSYPVTRKEIKKRYKELVKRHHPDVNGNDKKAEEKFKTIGLAYSCLKESSYFMD